MLLPSLSRTNASRWSFNLLRSALAGTQRGHFSNQACRTDNVVNLPVGGTGQIKLDISLPSGTSKNHILLYLPPGPYPKHPLITQLTNLRPTELASSLSDSTIVAVNYRLGPRLASEDRRFPTPIHDVFKAWDYIVDSNSPHNNVFGRDGCEYLEPTISLYGAHIGGALALTLALTNPEEIHALAIEEPLVDWTILDEFAEYNVVPSVQQSSRKPKSWLQSSEYLKLRADAARALIKLRTDLFRTPSGYFDNFASPTLFLRAPGRDTPLTRTAALVTPEQDEFAAFEGEEIRYGDDEDEIGWVESDENHDAFGPYDDDYHAVVAKGEAALLDGDILDSSSNTSDSDWKNTASDGTIIQSLTDLSLWSKEQGTSKRRTSTRRRKVLRRWPPNMQPGDAMLPYVQIYLREPHPPQVADRESFDLSPVTYSEGTELQELLRRACFWGREKGLSEDRVNITLAARQTNALSNEKALLWLQAKFQEAS